MNTFIIYTDGCCMPNPGIGSYAYVILSQCETNIIKQSVNVDNNTTNNRMEYKAFIYAVNECNFTDKLTVYSDSQLLVNTFNNWIDSWAKKDWKRKKSSIKNLDLVKELFYIKNNYRSLELRWIRGHSGNKWNEYVDSLCLEPFP